MKKEITEKNKEHHKWWHVFVYGDRRRLKQYRAGMLGPRVTPDIDVLEIHCEGCCYVKEIETIYESSD